jgi:cell division protein FtsI/penicillin-binding protein 2
MRNWRINLILFFFILFSATIISRLIYIQIIKGDLYKALAQGQQNFFSLNQGERGKIFLQDKNGNFYPVAVNKNWEMAYAVPKEIGEKEKIAEILSRLLDLESKFILEKINNEDSYFIPLKNKLTNEETEQLKSLAIPGIYTKEEVSRYYPQERLASNVIGFLGGDGIGQYGIEGYYEDVLRGREEAVAREKGLKGFLIKDPEQLLAQNGSDLVLSIDYNIQFVAEKLLQDYKKQLEFEEGQIIVIDPSSGKILALVQFPNFDLNNYAQESDLKIFQNGAIQKIYEPGSVFKPFTMAAALDKEKVTPQTVYKDEGVIKIGGYRIYNYDQRTWGERTMTEVLEKSINTGAVFAQRQIGNEIFLDYLKNFGFFEKTGIDLQGEIFSENKEFKKGYEVNFATASFGQGIEVTPIQIVRAFCALANGGKLVKPYVVEKVIKSDGEVEKKDPEIGRQVISSKTASTITAMLISVVEKGTAKRAKIPGYYIAGKTGTAQVAFSALGIQKSGYSEKTIQTFVGYAPAFNPKFLILVKLDNPNVRTAEISAVPVFHDLAKYIFDYLQIPPDYE